MGEPRGHALSCRAGGPDRPIPGASAAVAAAGPVVADACDCFSPHAAQAVEHKDLPTEVESVARLQSRLAEAFDRDSAAAAALEAERNGAGPAG
jgi:hypothetical protein